MVAAGTLFGAGTQSIKRGASFSSQEIEDNKQSRSLWGKGRREEEVPTQWETEFSSIRGKVERAYESNVKRGGGRRSRQKIVERPSNFSLTLKSHRV